MEMNFYREKTKLVFKHDTRHVPVPRVGEVVGFMGQFFIVDIVVHDYMREEVNISVSTKEGMSHV